MRYQDNPDYDPAAFREAMQAVSNDYRDSQVAPIETDEELDELYIQVFDAVMNEDFMNLEPMHRSIASGALESIPLNYQERRIYHLHEEIDRVIGEGRIPEALRVAPRLAPFCEKA